MLDFFPLEDTDRDAVDVLLLGDMDVLNFLPFEDPAAGYCRHRN